MLKQCLAGIFLAAFSLPAHSQDAARRNAIIERLNQQFTAVQFRDVGSPYFQGDDVRAIIEITPREDDLGRPLFLSGTYKIYGSGGPAEIGRHLCTLAEEYVTAERRDRADFLDGFKVSQRFPVGPFIFEVTVNGDALEGMVRGILNLADALEGDDREYEILIAGSADAAPPSYENTLDPDFTPVVANPPSPSDPTSRLIFLRNAASNEIGNPFGNDDLPLLRGEFMKRILLEFLQSCRGTGIAIPPFVLNVPPYSVPDESLRSVKVYFYVRGQ